MAQGRAAQEARPGQAARTSHVRGKSIQPAKGPQSFCPSLKHETESLFCLLGSVSILFWKETGDTFLKRKLSGALPGRAGWMWVLVTRKHSFPASTVIIVVSAPRRHREAKAGRHWSKPSGRTAQGHLLEAFAQVCGMATLLWVPGRESE